MDLPDVNGFTPEDLYVLYSKIGPDTLSKFPVRELLEKGWVIPGGPIGWALGQLVWLPQDTTGRTPIVEQNSLTISGTATAMRNQINWADSLPRLVSADLGSSYALSVAAKRIFTWIPYSIAGGADADQEIWPALSSYFGVCELMYWQQGSAVADEWQHVFQDEDDNPCNGLFGGTVYQDVEADRIYTVFPFGGGNVNYPMIPIVIWQGTDDKAIEVDTVGQNVNTGLMHKGWYES